MNQRVLIVEDEEVLARSMARFLQRRGFLVETASDGNDAWDRLRAKSFDVVTTDIRMPECDGLELLERMKDEGLTEPAIVMSAHGNFEKVVAAMRLGARDFLRKPVDLEELEVVLRRSMADAQLRHELAYLRRRDAEACEFKEPLGESAAMVEIRDCIRNLGEVASRLAPGEVPPLLITGETGTGKGLLARYFHRLASRQDAPFIEVNCTTLQPMLIASELFGHERGAFTDAKMAKKGLFEAAETGTLYLDEIGHLQPEIQGNLLTAIEEKTIRPVGGREQRHVNVRIVATTNVDLEQSIARRQFRSDLYFRLATFQIKLPPLRDRREDIRQLATALLDQFSVKYGVRDQTIAENAVNLLESYDWPGNVRELKNFLERAVILAGSGSIEARHLQGLVEQRSEAKDGMKAPACPRFHLPEEGIDLDLLEADLLEQAKAKTKGNVAAAARLLGMTRSRFRSRLRRRRRRRPARES